ncbi:hypothetical protein [Hathewaya massiliensis]|uniref:hypothetical protein n=1 Tax=Hathewaya massiliensis TaxID=1964382 RepID=UPI001159BCC2|nr:hypothetical protein [Hathewaya massiliensis]
MNNINKIAELIKLYLQKNTCVRGRLEIKNIIELIPVLQFAVIALTSIFGVIKYYKTKNKEIYEKRLKEVYAPLYMRLVSQEIYRDILITGKSIKEIPIISVKENEYKNGERIGGISILTQEDFWKIINGINGGLATQELLTLIALYRSLVDLEESLKRSEKTEEFLTATIKKIKVEYDLYKEIVRGYTECYKKLGLDKYSKIEQWETNNDEIKIKYNITEEERKRVREELENKGAN